MFGIKNTASRKAESKFENMTPSVRNNPCIVRNVA